VKIIADKAEVAVDFPDKAYVGSFGHNARFEAKADQAGVALRLERHDGGEKREVNIHLHHGLFADMIEEIARALAAMKPLDERHREDLLTAARHLVVALGGKG
jgi:hypothetical protein